MAANKPLEKTTDSLFDSWDPNVAKSGPVDDLVSKRMTVWGVVATAVGVISFLALVHIGFICISVAAIFFAIMAFITIGLSGGELAGKRWACLGLALGLITAIAGPVRTYTYRSEFNKQADQFCKTWLETVKKGEIAQARMSLEPYWRRPTIVTHDDEVNYWIRAIGSGDEEPHYAAHAYLANSTMLTLATFGDRANVSFYKTTGSIITASKEQTERIYAITVEPETQGGKPQTFFIRIVATRSYSKTEEGEKLIGWSTISSDLAPMELDAQGRPTYELM